MLQSILSNIAIILLMHLTMSMLLNLRERISPRILSFSIISLVSCAVIAIFYLPIQFGEYWLDMRFIPLIFLAYIQGPTVTLPALLITCTWRFFIGGAGMLPGIVFGMILPTLLALSLHHRSRLQGHYLEKISVVIVCWFLCDFPIIFFIPNGYEVFSRIASIRCFSFVATAIILYTFIVLERQRSSLNDQLHKLAGEDPLTKLLNKRRFFEMLKEKVDTHDSEHYVAMIDIDYFKRLNDTYGHVIGDDILCKTGEILKKYERDNLIIGRYGGEEFIVFIGDATLEHAKKVAENIRQEIRTTVFLLDNGVAIHITVSIGLAKLNRHSPLLHIVNIADQNLYKAKKNGRDCLIV